MLHELSTLARNPASSNAEQAKAEIFCVNASRELKDSAANSQTKPVKLSAEMKPDERAVRKKNSDPYYISALNTRRNPDILLPAGTLRGNLYFKRTLGRKSETEDPAALEVEVKPQLEEQLEDDEFERMKH